MNSCAASRGEHYSSEALVFLFLLRAIQGRPSPWAYEASTLFQDNMFKKFRETDFPKTLFKKFFIIRKKFWWLLLVSYYWLQICNLPTVNFAFYTAPIFTNYLAFLPIFQWSITNCADVYSYTKFSSSLKFKKLLPLKWQFPLKWQSWRFLLHSPSQLSLWCKSFIRNLFKRTSYCLPQQYLILISHVPSRFVLLYTVKSDRI